MWNPFSYHRMEHKWQAASARGPVDANRWMNQVEEAADNRVSGCVLNRRWGCVHTYLLHDNISTGEIGDYKSRRPLTRNSVFSKISFMGVKCRFSRFLWKFPSQVNEVQIHTEQLFSQRSNKPGCRLNNFQQRLNWVMSWMRLSN